MINVGLNCWFLGTVKERRLVIGLDLLYADKPKWEAKEHMIWIWYCPLSSLFTIDFYIPSIFSLNFFPFSRFVIFYCPILSFIVSISSSSRCQMPQFVNPFNLFCSTSQLHVTKTSKLTTFFFFFIKRYLGNFQLHAFLFVWFSLNTTSSSLSLDFLCFLIWPFFFQFRSTSGLGRLRSLKTCLFVKEPCDDFVVHK